MIKIPVSKPVLHFNEKKYLDEAMKEVEISGHGRHVKIFEEKFAKYIGSEYAIMTSSGTTALFAAVAATLGSPIVDPDVKPLRVLIPESTLISPASAVLFNGHNIVLADVDKASWTLYTKDRHVFGVGRDEYDAAIPTHIYSGVPCLFPAHNGTIQIEDAAEALGSKIGNKYVGTIGNVGCFSLYASKMMTSGEGGVVVTNDLHISLKIRDIVNLGLTNANSPYAVNRISLNLRPSNLQAAIALGQLENIHEILHDRKYIDDYYRNNLNPDYYIFQDIPELCYSAGYYTSVLVGPMESRINSRSKLELLLKDNGIDTRRLFPSLGSVPGIKKLIGTKVRRTSYYYSDAIYDRGIILPSSGPDLTTKTLRMICDLCNQFADDNK